jgi:3-hydroxymyristoyl/3-hydroxydecanoyl-(acyl carrier protein) dehydratase
MLQISQDFVIAADHPSLAGHFPNNPIVPGVLLLDYARELLQLWQPQWRIKTLAQVKFLQPVTPTQLFTLTLSQISAEKIKFECGNHQRNALFAHGAFIVETTT